MAIKLNVKPKVGGTPPAQQEAPAESPAQKSPAPTQKAPAQKAPAGNGLSFLKKGKAAQETFAKEEHKAEVRQKGQVFRFFVPEGKDASITFVDGDLVEGVLDIPFYYEHNVNMNGKWGNFFICTQDEEPCPVCEGGLNPSYVGIMTVIDHSSYVSSKDNKTYKDQVRLFVAKRETVKTLQKLAAKRGGLAGCRFDVSRTGDKSPSVGNVFDFTEKITPAQIEKLYGAEKAKPINYEEYLGGMYMPAKELRKLGFGSSMPPVGSESASEADYADKM